MQYPRPLLAALAFAMVASLAAAPVAMAVEQSKDQQKCLNGILKRGRKVTGTVLKEGRTCVKKAAKGKLGAVTGQDCLTGDLKGKIAKAESKVTSQAAKSCGTALDPEFPDFGFTEAATVSLAHNEETIDTFGDLFLDDLDTALAGGAATDPGGRCASTLPNALRKVADGMQKEYGSCIKSGLKGASVIDTAGMETCLDAIKTDSRGRVAKAVGRVAGQLVAKCPGGNLDAIFPGMVEICTRYTLGTDANDLGTCSGLRMSCRACRTMNAAHGLDRDCDLYDNGAVDGTCPRCGNTVVDTGEECDDGNLVGGDGCDAECLCEFCGDGILNNGTVVAECGLQSGIVEECDDGVGNDDSAADACRTDCTLAHCGDGVTDTGETCDDGDETVTDSCPDGPAGTCVPAACGDPFVCSDGDCTTGPGSGPEECDDNNASNTDACLNTCTDAACGDTFVRTGVEDCDDGNAVGGDCCGGSCLFETIGSICVGSGDVCTAPQCDGAGTCNVVAANEGLTCEDNDDCTIASECQSGVCTATAEVVLGQACNWLVVGEDDTDTLVRCSADVTSDGPWCGSEGFFGQNSVFGDDIVIVEADGSNVAMKFGSNVNADAADIVTNNAIVEGDLGAVLPGVGVDTIAAGQVFPKTPGPTVYDTTGTDARVARCQNAQAALGAAKSLLDAFSTTTDFGATYEGLAAAATPATITAANVGGLNVFDFDNITGLADVTITLDGAGDADSVFVMRVANKIDTSPGWQFVLQNGLTASKVLWYVQGAGATKCNFSSMNTGEGTLYCPDTKVSLALDSVWNGAFFGGGGGSNQISFGIGVQLTHQKFDGL